MILVDGTIRHRRKSLDLPNHAHELTFTCYNRYKLLSKERTRQWLQAANYIHANPVRRGLVESPTDWEWSSARWYEGERDVKLEMDASLPC